MSTKDNIEYIKKELSSQEKLLQGLFHFEQFYKKRQKLLIILLSILTIAIIAFAIKGSMDDSNNIKANIAYNNLLSGEYSKDDESILKKYNSDLYNIYKFKQAIKSSNIQNEKLSPSTMPMLKDLLEYQKAILSNSPKILDKYSLKQSASLKDFALLSEIFLLIEQNKIADAKEKLRFMPATSELRGFTSLLHHYLATK